MLKLNNYESMLNFGSSKGDFWKNLLKKLNPMYWVQVIKEKIQDYKDKKKRKEMRRAIKRALKNTFSTKTLQKIVIAFVSIALIASYILPYIIR